MTGRHDGAGSSGSDVDLLERLIEASAQVRRLVPQCVGMSVTLRDQGVTLTLVASDETVARLDAAQYLAGGPCVEVAWTGKVIDLETRQRLAWPFFAAAADHHGVASTLSLPLLDAGAGAGGVNLYGATSDCFDGHHDRLAEMLGAWAGGAVTDADLSFAARATTSQATRILREGAVVDAAVGLMAAHLDVEVSEARRRLTDAGERAGTPVIEVAELVIEMLGSPAPTDA